jgi:protein TonB
VTSKKSFRRRLPGLFAALFLLLVAGGMVMLIKGFLSSEPDKKPRVQQISLIKPPEPKPEEKPPEPEQKPPEVKEEVKLDEPPPPEPQPADAPPPGPDLGVDAKGEGGGDQFGLVGKPGGRELTTIGGNGSRFGGYLGGLQQHIRDALNRNEKIRSGEYKIIVKLWIAPSGSVDRFELVNSSGDAEVDAAMKRVLASIKPLQDAPPEDMPQPVRLRISSR